MLQMKYEAEIERVNFVEDANAIISSVNAWVSERTNEKIPMLATEKSINENTVFTFLSVMYFKGESAVQKGHAHC